MFIPKIEQWLCGERGDKIWMCPQQTEEPTRRVKKVPVSMSQMQANCAPTPWWITSVLVSYEFKCGSSLAWLCVSLACCVCPFKSIISCLQGQEEVRFLSLPLFCQPPERWALPGCSLTTLFFTETVHPSLLAVRLPSKFLEGRHATAILIYPSLRK